MSRALSEAERALWRRVAETVRPFEGRRIAAPAILPHLAGDTPGAGKRAMAKALPVAPAPAPPPKARGAEHPRPLDRHGLDAGWDRRLAKGAVAPDFTLDLHGATLDAAHARLDHGLTQALAQGARMVLLITGRPRQADAGGRGERRGAIRAKFLDWLAAGPHASRIAAIRPAHPRHGGAGAVYIVLKRTR